MSRSALILTVLFVTLPELASGGQPASRDSVRSSGRLVSVSESRKGAWWIATTENFQVYSLRGAIEAWTVATGAENLRQELSAELALPADAAAWNPKCQIILYSNRQQYCAAVGAPFAKTLGSSLVRPATGEITTRRIDLRTDITDYLTEALPHELCHVLVADHFREQAPPLWYDEGLALLADTESKRLLHERDLVRGLRQGLEIPLDRLMTAKSYPASGQIGVFYGQCASLAQFLHRQGPPEKIHQFIRRSKEVGVNLALVECYAIDGLPQLQQMWRESVKLGHREVSAPALLGHSDTSASLADGLARY